MLERLLCRGCPVYKGPRLAPRPCALSLRQDSLPPAGPEQGRGPRSEATPAVPATIAIPEPCQCFLVWGKAQSQHPSVHPSVGWAAGLCSSLYQPRHHKGFLWSSLPSRQKSLHIRVSTPKRLQLLLSGHPVAVCLHPHLNKSEEPGAGMDAGGGAVQMPSPQGLPHVLWICPCTS